MVQNFRLQPRKALITGGTFEILEINGCCARALCSLRQLRLRKRLQLFAIRAGCLFDSKSGKIAENQIILSQEKNSGRRAGGERTIPAGAALIELSNATVLPGLIDGHTHVFGFGARWRKPGGPPFASPIRRHSWYRTLLALSNATKDLPRRIHYAPRSP